ncbi:hypothetical protein HHK36_012050 [Tetracentron sinense]|uniref:Dirigent protein n=1 Tax=Tetracentron sinense TaxID=13715 RepID=A0A834ZEZ8_TETSI|nr:hypothetical protein HHK36_012050 [Tetracentron sinense]
MAGILSKFTSNCIIFFTILFLSNFAVEGKSEGYARSLNPEKVGLKQEKLTHFHFYFHDTVSGHNPTAVRVAQAPTTNMSATGFGAVLVFDDLLTVGPEPTSKLIGKAQGLYASASQSELSILMGMNFAFMEGKYNGSTISVLGRNAVFLKVREMPIVGGSGIFRFARGYVQAKTLVFNIQSGNAIVDDIKASFVPSGYLDCYYPMIRGRGDPSLRERDIQDVEVEDLRRQIQQLTEQLEHFETRSCVDDGLTSKDDVNPFHFRASHRELNEGAEEDREAIKCFKCSGVWHISSEYPYKKFINLVEEAEFLKESMKEDDSSTYDDYQDDGDDEVT